MGCLCDELAGKDLQLSPVCVGHLWLFENLREDELEALKEAALRKRYSSGQFIFYQGDPAEQMFLVKGGKVKLSKVLENGTEITLDIRKEGDFLGEHILSEEMDYPMSARSLDDSVICGFSRNGFENLVKEYPNIGWQVIRNLSKRVSLLTVRVGSMALSNLSDRLSEVLIDVAREHGVEDPAGKLIPFPLTHEDLGFLVGAHRVSVTRALKDLRASGRIAHRGRNLIIRRDGAAGSGSDIE